MAINKNKINDNALKYIQKGQVKKAIKEYEKILAEDPADVRTLLKKGDLLVRVGEKEQAVDTYLRVATTYSQQGFHLKAVAVFKQILKIDEARIDVNLRLAEEYQNLGIAGDAMAHLQRVAGYYDQQGMARESLDIFRRIVELDPENVASRIKLAELYSREGMTAEAVEEFTRAAEDLKAANRVEDYIKVAERLIYHDSTNIALVRELSNIYLQRGDTKRALGKLQICFKTDPRDLETLGMLAMAFQELNQLSKTVSVYKEMAKIYQEQGADAEVQQIYRRITEIVPDDPEANQLLSGGGGATGMAGTASASGAGLTAEAEMPGMDDESGVNFPADPEMTLEQTIPPPPEPAMEPYEDSSIPSAEVVLSAPLHVEQPTLLEQPVPTEELQEDSEQSRELVSRLLTETDVYVKYGLQNKALEHLNRIFQLDPHNIEAHDKLKDLYVGVNQMEHAAQELLTLAQLTAHHGRDEEARAYLRSLLSIAPDHPDGLSLANRLGEAVPDQAEEPAFEPGMDPGAPEVAVLDDESSVQLGTEDAFDLVADGQTATVESQAVGSDAGMGFDEGEGSGASIDIVEDVPIDFDEADLLDGPDEASTVIAGHDPMDLDAAPAAEAAGADDGVQFLDYEGVEDTAEISALTTGEYPGGEVPEIIDSLEEPEIIDSLEEPEIVELVEDEDVVEVEDLPLLDGGEPELIEFGDEESFFDEEQRMNPAPILDPLPELEPAMDSLAMPGPPTLVSEPPQGFGEDLDTDGPIMLEPVEEFSDDLLDSAPLMDEFDVSEMSTMVGSDAAAALPPGPTSNLPEHQEMPALAEPVEPAEEPDEEELADALEEIDFFLQQNLVDEAEDELGRLRELYPDHPEVVERVTRIEGLRQGEAPALQIAADEQDGAFDLASEIEREAGEDAAPVPLDEDFQYSFDDVFDEFKKGVERVVAKEDSTTHFDLGIAYKEMGLIDDAISEFTIAAHDMSKKASALSMIGLCHVEKGQYSEAINRFKDALHGEISEQEATGVYYEMGQTYELLNDVEEALFYYKKVRKRDAGFRDVKARIKALGKPGSGGDEASKPDKPSGSKNKISYM